MFDWPLSLSSPSLSSSFSLQKQLLDYTAWVNNYLKKRKPSIPLVTDIKSNFQDGITFVYLAEIVGREML